MAEWGQFQAKSRSANALRHTGAEVDFWFIEVAKLQEMVHLTWELGEKVR